MSFEGTDLLSLDVHTDNPYPFYEWLLEECPLYWDSVNDLWAVSRYEDVVYVSKHTELFCSGQGVIPNLGLDMWPDDAMINKDGDAHTQQRRLVSKGFTPGRIERMEGRIREICGELLLTVQKHGKADLVKDLTRPLPMIVIGEMLGYPKERILEVLDWTDTYAHAGCGPAHITDEVNEAFGQFADFHLEQIEERKKCPGEDLLSVWLKAEIDGHKLSEDTLMFEHNLLLVGGSETTRNTISMGFVELMKNPDQQAWLVANLDNPEAIEGAVEEFIRWSSPFVRMRRTATQDVVMHGKTIKEGDQIVMLYPAATRDPRAYENPNTFDIKRRPEVAQLSFGHGKHFCLGAALARLESRVMTEAILRRLPDISLQPDNPPVRNPSSFIRGLRSCPVSFSPVE